MSDKPFILRIPFDTWLSIKNPTARGVFMAVFSFADNGCGECFASQRAIAKRAGYARQTIQRMLEQLTKQGFLKVAGSQPVRGGTVIRYVISGLQSATKSTKVADGGHEVADTVTQKQLKETIANAPINKPEPVREETWNQTLSSYQNSLVRYKAKGKAVRAPEQLFLKILRDTAARLNDHKYLASITSDAELKTMIDRIPEDGLISDVYFQEFQNRKGVK